jgi:hypothetical protein
VEVERANDTVKEVLRVKLGEDQSDWDIELPNDGTRSAGGLQQDVGQRGYLEDEISAANYCRGSGRTEELRSGKPAT